MSRAKRRRQAWVGYEADRWHQVREQLEAQGLTAREAAMAYEDILPQVYDPLPKDRAEQRRLASICRRCGQEGHHAKACPLIECFKCGQRGHMEKQCPTPSQ